MEAKMCEGEGGEKRRYRVGYALEAKKVKSLMRPSLLKLAAERGIDLVPIQTLLVDQHPPLDCILHKLYQYLHPNWNAQLLDYYRNHPDVVIVDHPDSIAILHNRISMLHAVSQINCCRVPNQLLISDSASLSDQTLTKQLNFPVIVKPLIADGSLGSHKMSLVFNESGFNKLDLETPFVLQEFVKHGGVIYKVYVAGEYVQCVKRRSLPDAISDPESGEQGILSFSQISNLAMVEGEVEMPPSSFVAEVAKGLQQSLKLNLFNFDVIKDKSCADDVYLVIDINYFPGYEKLPSYESMLTDFFWDILHKKQ